MESPPANGLATAGRLLEALAARDWAAVEGCFAPDGALRALTPRSLREDEGAAAAAERFRFWFDELEEYRLDGEVEPVADRVRVRYRVHGRHRERGWTGTEHTAYLRIEDGRIAAMDDVCSGFRPAAGP